MRAWHLKLAVLAVIAVSNSVLAQSTAPQVPTDWDLYMLQLVNRARTDPTGEDDRQGTNYRESPAPPLAYSPRLGRAAQNHSEWMGANRNNPLLSSSLHHRESVDDGRSGEGLTVGWSGDSFGDRIRYTGYRSNWKGENILKQSRPTPLNMATMEENHSIWWNSSGHRDLLTNPVFRAFGHHAVNDTEGPGRRHWATEIFAETRPVRTHMLGVLYSDIDGSGDWTPRDTFDPRREGLGQVPIHVLNGKNVVATGKTMDNGAFAINVESGVYDLVFGYDLGINDVNLSNRNLDIGDLTATPAAGDADRNLVFDQMDIVKVLSRGRYLTGQMASWGDGDWTNDGFFDQRDVVAASQTGLYLKTFQPPEVRVNRAFSDPVGGWIYAYEGDSAQRSDNAALDGTWSHDNDSDSWDGRGIGEGRPGGVSILKEDDVTFARFQDTGNPRQFGFSDPSNRKIFFTRDIMRFHDLNEPFLDNGFTFSFRARLATGDMLDDRHPQSGGRTRPWPANGLGMTIDFNSVGMFRFQQPVSEGSLGFTLATRRSGINRDLRQAGLLMNSLNGNRTFNEAGDTDGPGDLNLLPIDDLTEWHEFWVTIEASGNQGTHRVNVYLDGSATPNTFEVTAGTSSHDSHLAMGMGVASTVLEGAMDLDFVAYKPGVIAPTIPNAEAQIVPEPSAIVILFTGAFALTLRRIGPPTPRHHAGALRTCHLA